MIRFRFTFQKFGNIRFTGTLDMQKIWERTCRRADLNIAYSQGFHPQARIQQAAPLPLGIEGLAEIVDIWFYHDVELNNLKERINDSLPSGIKVDSVLQVDLHEESLQNRIIASTYSINNLSDSKKNILNRKIEFLLDSHEILIERRGKQINIRERINYIEIQDLPNRQITVSMNLKHLPGMTGRPEDVLVSIGINPHETIIVRERLHFKD